MLSILLFILSFQTCSLKFGSWTYDAWRVDIKAESALADTKTTQVNGEWDLVGFPCGRNVMKYECCPQPYSDVTCTLKLRRRTTYFFVNLIVPCFLITRKLKISAVTVNYMFLNPFTPKISLLILFTARHTIPIMLLRRIISTNIPLTDI